MKLRYLPNNKGHEDYTVNKLYTVVDIQTTPYSSMVLVCNDKGIWGWCPLIDFVSEEFGEVDYPFSEVGEEFGETEGVV